MKRIKILLDFLKLSIAEKIAFYRNVIAKLTGNPDFPTPDVPLAEAKTAVDKLEESYLASKDGGRTAIALMHDQEAAADTIFRKLAGYVDRISDSEEAKMLGSGFSISRQPASIQKATLSVEDGDKSGCVKLVAKAVDKAGAYIWQYAKDVPPAVDSEWIHAGTGTRSYFDLDGLTPVSRYFFRMAAVTPEGTSDFCPPVAKVVI